jgi:hypothetical protein
MKMSRKSCTIQLTVRYGARIVYTTKKTEEISAYQVPQGMDVLHTSIEGVCKRIQQGLQAGYHLDLREDITVDVVAPFQQL